jgi:hypothetical protein
MPYALSWPEEQSHSSVTPSCFSPVYHATIRAFPSLTSMSDLCVSDGRRLAGVSHKRRVK